MYRHLQTNYQFSLTNYWWLLIKALVKAVTWVISKILVKHWLHINLKYWLVKHWLVWVCLYMRVLSHIIFQQFMRRYTKKDCKQFFVTLPILSAMLEMALVLTRSNLFSGWIHWAFFKKIWFKTPIGSLPNYPQFSQSPESREVLPNFQYSKIFFFF